MRIATWMLPCVTATAAMLALAPVAHAQDALDDLPATPYEVGTITDQKDPRSGKTRLAGLVARVLSPDELRNYALTLHLSAAQRAVVRDAYLAYREKIDTLNAEYQEPVASLSVKAGEMTQSLDWEFLRVVTEVRGLLVKYERKLVEHDQALLNSIQALLAEPQKPSFERVTLRRARNRCQQFNIRISPGYIDFVELVEKYIKDTDVLGDLEPLLLEYERLITPLYLAVDESKRQIELDQYRELVASRYAADGKTLLIPNSPEGTAAGRAYLDRLQEILGRSIPQQERLADINRQYIEKLKSAIPPDQFAPLSAEYLRQAFPYIHPDPCDPTSLMQDMLAVPGLDPDLRTLMQARFDQWREAYDAITHEMEEHYIAYNKHFARTSTSEAVHTPAIRKLRFDRWACSEEALKSLKAMLPGSVKAPFDRQVINFQKRLTDERTREANPRRGNP